MPTNYLPGPGELINKAELKIPKALEVISAIEKLDYYSLVEVRRITSVSAEVIIFDAEIEVGQRVVNDIRCTERIAVVFEVADKSFPEVLALRDDFPRVPHLNLRLQDKPRSLCLFDEKYSEFKFRWTSTLFLERIREWLALTAKGKLHDYDQRLEPLLLGSPINLIIPFDLFSSKESVNEFLRIRRADILGGGFTLIAEREEDAPPVNPHEIGFLAIPIQGEPQTHGIINKQPSNLSELHNFLLKANVDLLSILRSEFIKFNKEDKYKQILEHCLVIIVCLPKKRIESSPVESVDIWAFTSSNAIKDFGVEIGAWEIKDGSIAYIIGGDDGKDGRAIILDLLNPILSFSRERARIMSGLPQSDVKDMLLIGAGALGSQVFMNLIRMGYGRWSIVDEDCLLPHNLARHILPGECVGYSKAQSLAIYAKNIFPKENIAIPLIADVLQPSDELKECYKKTDIIIDAATSVPVARYIACDVDSSARRISIFLNPSGTDSVLIAEDEKRIIPLDCLEMQYYRYLINEPALSKHLKRSDGIIRYGYSCRDISSTIPQDFVALHSAICSRAIMNAISDVRPVISIWKMNARLAIENYDVPIYKTAKHKNHDWTLYIDEWLLEKIFTARKDKLPNETGGILIGSFDMQRKIVYIVDTVLSPPDSEEWPTVYIRGCEGLKQRVDDIKKITGGMLDYIGEWHSHASGIKPSNDDQKAFTWLVDIMDIYGLPALMMIAGDRDRYSLFIGRMEA